MSIPTPVVRSCAGSTLLRFAVGCAAGACFSNERTKMKRSVLLGFIHDEDRRLKRELTIAWIAAAVFLASSICLAVELHHSRVFIHQLLTQASPQ